MGCYICRIPSYPRGYELSPVYLGLQFSVKLFIVLNSFLEVGYADLGDVMHFMNLPYNNSHYVFVILWTLFN